MKNLAFFFLLSAILIAGCGEEQTSCYCDRVDGTHTSGTDTTLSFPKDTQTVLVGNNATILEENFIQFTIPAGNWSLIYWEGTNLSCADCPNPLTTWGVTWGVSGVDSPSITKEYQVHLYDTAFNEVTFTSYVTYLLDSNNFPYLYIPNAFTPNGDGVNDLFFAIGNGFYRYHLVIKDGGTTVFETFNKNEGWDGTINGSIPDCTNFDYILDVTFYDGGTAHLEGEATLFKTSCPDNFKNCRFGSQFDGAGFNPNIAGEAINCQ